MVPIFALSLDEQIERLATLGSTRKLTELDLDTDSYPNLLTAFQSLLPLDESRLLLAAYAVFGWMPTQILVEMKNLPAATSILRRVFEVNAALTEDDLRSLAETFRTQNGKSVVAVSKVLHFFAPDRFPIWDSRVCKTWGRSPSGPNAPQHYLEFCTACRQIADDPKGIAMCQSFHDRLADAGLGYPMSATRLVELILYLRG